MKKSIVIILGSLMLFILYQSCNDCNTWGDCEPKYDFEIVDSLIRENDTVNIGDTIWLGTSFSDSLLLFDNSPKKVYSPNANFEIGVRIKDAETNLFAAPQFVIANGSYDEWGVIMAQNNNMYFHKVGLIFSKRGIYFIEIVKGYASSPDNCDCNDGTIHPVIFVNKNRNINLIPKEFVPEADSNQLVAFVVK